MPGKIDGVNFWDKCGYGVKIVLSIFGVFLIHLWLKNILKDWIKIYNFVFLILTDKKFISFTCAKCVAFPTDSRE